MKEKFWQNEVLKLAKDLIRFKTTADKPTEVSDCINFVKDYLNQDNIKVESFNKNGCVSLLITIFPSGKDSLKLLWHGHLDVVPGNSDQFKPRVKEGYLYGRGALDMKGAVAAMIVLMKKLAEKEKFPPLGLLLTTDEETGGYSGSGYLVKEIGLRPQFVISAEPTWLKIGNEAKGILQLMISAKGHSAHAAKPWEGKNAINIMVEYLARISPKYFPPELGKSGTTFNLATIVGGDALNKVPDRCDVQLDIRYVPEESAEVILARLKTDLPELEIHLLNQAPAAFCNPDNEFVRRLQESITKATDKPAEFIRKEAASDVRHFTAGGIPGVVFGPSGGGSHSKDERIDLKSLWSFSEVLEDLARFI